MKNCTKYRGQSECIPIGIQKATKITSQNRKETKKITEK